MWGTPEQPVLVRVQRVRPLVGISVATEERGREVMNERRQEGNG